MATAHAKAKPVGKKARGRGPDEVATEEDVRVRVFEGHTMFLHRVAMPADGRFALTTSRDGTVRRWDLDGEAGKGVVLHRGTSVMGLAVTLDGHWGAVGEGNVENSVRDRGQSQIYLLDLSGNRLARHWRGHEAGSTVGGLAFLDGGGRLLSGGSDGRLCCWNAAAGELTWKVGDRGDTLFNVATSGERGRIVVSAPGQGLLHGFGGSDAALVHLQEYVATMAPVSVADDGRFAWTGTRSGQVACWDLEEGRRVTALEGHREAVYAVAVTPDGRWVVSGGEDKTVRLWVAGSGRCVAVLRGHRQRVLHVSVTPDGRRIASASYDKTLRVWDIPEGLLEQAADTRKRGYMNAKVVLVGDSGVGKSGLALRLWHDRWEKTESTHGMEIQKLVLPSTEADPEVVREIWLWDLAGQADYRLTHQLFMEQTALALLVFDPQDERLFDTIGYWQKALAKVAGKNATPGILVAARCDRPKLQLTEEEVREWGAARGLHGPVLTAAKLKTHHGVRELRALMEKLLPWDKMEFRSTPENFSALKDAILVVRGEAEAKGGVVVTPTELEQRVRKVAPMLTFTSEDLCAVTGLLAGEGVLHPLPYGGLVVLQPSWVNCYAGTLVKLAGQDKTHLGHVPLAWIQPGKLPREEETEATAAEEPASDAKTTKKAAKKSTGKKARKAGQREPAKTARDEDKRLSLEDERQLLPALQTLFLKRALAWKQDTIHGPMLVFPSYVRRPHPNPPQRPGSTVQYRFTGPLEEIYCTLVVQLHYSRLFSTEETKLYRKAVDFRTATGGLVALTMREEGERGELEIYFDVNLVPDMQATCQRFVDDHLRGKAGELERLRHYFCPKCHEEVTDRKAIDAALGKKRTKIACIYCDPEDGPGIIDLHDVLEQQLVSAAGEAGADRARRVAREGITTASMEGIMVGEVQEIVFRADQIYRGVNEPDEGVDGEIEFRNLRKKAVGLTYRVQLKSGRSHLKKRTTDGAEVFAMKGHYEDHWARKGVVDVLLIIRTEDERSGEVSLRFMNATKAIRAAQRANPGKPVKQIVFEGEPFTEAAVLKLRDGRLRE